MKINKGDKLICSYWTETFNDIKINVKVTAVLDEYYYNNYSGVVALVENEYGRRKLIRKQFLSRQTPPDSKEFDLVDPNLKKNYSNKIVYLAHYLYAEVYVSQLLKQQNLDTQKNWLKQAESLLKDLDNIRD